MAQRVLTTFPMEGTSTPSWREIASDNLVERLVVFANQVGADEVVTQLAGVVAASTSESLQVAVVGGRSEIAVATRTIARRLPAGSRLVNRMNLPDLASSNDLVIVASIGAYHARIELERLAAAGCVRRNLATLIIGKERDHVPGVLLDACAVAVVFEPGLSNPAAIAPLLDLLARRVTETPAMSLQRRCAAATSLALTQLRVHLEFRRRALLQPKQAELEAARLSRFCLVLERSLEGGVEDSMPEIAARIASRLDRERTKLMMSMKAELLERLVARVRPTPPRCNARTVAAAIADDLVAETLHRWREDLRRFVSDDIATLHTLHRERLHVLVYGVNLDMERLGLSMVSMFACPWRSRVVATSPSRIERFVDAFHTTAGKRRRALGAASRALLSSLEAESRRAIEEALAEIPAAKRTIERQLCDATGEFVRRAHAASSFAAACHHEGAGAVVRELSCVSMQLSDLREIESDLARR